MSAHGGTLDATHDRNFFCGWCAGAETFLLAPSSHIFLRALTLTRESTLTHSLAFLPFVECSLSSQIPTHDPRPLFLLVCARQSPWQMDLPAIAFPLNIWGRCLRVHLITPVRVPHGGCPSGIVPHRLLSLARNAVVQQDGNYLRLT